MGWPPGIRAGVTEHVKGVTLRACGSGLAPPEVGPATSPSLRSLTKLVTLFGPSILFPLVGTYPFCRSCHPRRYYVAPPCQEPWLCHTQLLSPCHSLSSGCSSPWNERDRAELHGSASNQPRDLGN